MVEPSLGPSPGDQLSRERILAGALELVDQDGLEALTMRRLADALKVDPMSLYNHVESKDDLLDGLTETLWREFEQRIAGGVGDQGPHHLGCLGPRQTGCLQPDQGCVNGLERGRRAGSPGRSEAGRPADMHVPGRGPM
jgi:AcrR family transcriptional regulator